MQVFIQKMLAQLKMVNEIKSIIKKGKEISIKGFAGLYKMAEEVLPWGVVSLMDLKITIKIPKYFLQNSYNHSLVKVR